MAKYWIANNPNAEITDSQAQKLAGLDTSELDVLEVIGDTTATAAELNLLDADNTEPADGVWNAVTRWAKAEYAFAVDGGAISAIGLGVTIPDNAIVVGGFVEVVTTCTSSDDSGEMALHIQTANDLVTATAISGGSNIWDAGIHSIVPAGTGATAIKCTAARAITATITTDAFTAGKLNVWLKYVMGEA